MLLRSKDPLMTHLQHDLDFLYQFQLFPFAFMTSGLPFCFAFTKQINIIIILQQNDLIAHVENLVLVGKEFACDKIVKYHTRSLLDRGCESTVLFCMY